MSIRRLRLKARQSAEKRGHALTMFKPTWNNRSFTATCMSCGAFVVVTARPMPNEIDIGGSAVAISCKEKDHGMD